METKPTRTAFLGANFDTLSLDDAVDAIAAKASALQPFVYVATPNVDHLVRLNRDEASLSPLYEDAWLVLCDSRIVQPLARLSGLNLPVAPGADIAASLFQNSIEGDEPITVVGGSRETAQRLAARYQLSRLAHHIPPMGLRQNPDAIAAVADFIVDNPARFVFLCVGSPLSLSVAVRLVSVSVLELHWSF
jgi:N-acetylglucosaminyldiphosphoundecaprenol N-acetyl-beta-D-mannosaminyltransferase